MTEKNKLKILYILEMMRKTDENHPLNSSQIAAKLKRQGMEVERKSIGRVLDSLEEAGYSIIKCENHNLGWYMVDQEFENYEIKMLADAVATAKFLKTRWTFVAKKSIAKQMVTGALVKLFIRTLSVMSSKPMLFSLSSLQKT